MYAQKFSAFLLSCLLCIFEQLWALPLTEEPLNSQFEPYTTESLKTIILHPSAYPKLMLFADAAQEDGVDGGVGADVDEAKDVGGKVAGDDGDGNVDGDKPTKKLSINIPRSQTNIYGQWKFNPWGVSYADIFRDTRYFLNEVGRYPRLGIDFDPPKNYYYKENDSQGGVCARHSTLYHTAEEDKRRMWLGRRIYKRYHYNNVVKWDHRRYIYWQANSEECHTIEMTDWREYIECSLKRHQRMESRIKGYTFHQVETSTPARKAF